MTKSEAITSIVAKAEAFSGLTLDSEARLSAMAEQYYDMACAFTGFSVLPDALLPFVTTATIRAWNRRGAESVSAFSGISVRENYIDIEEELKKNLRKMKNPQSPVVIPPDPDPDPDPEEEPADDPDSEQDPDGEQDPEADDA